MMHVELSRNITESDAAKLEQLYLDSFPAEERRPWSQIINGQNEHGPQLYAVLDDGRIVGMVTMWVFDEFAYIEHLAIDPIARSKGIGTKTVELLQEKVGLKNIAVEIEVPDPELPQTIRRRKFYEHLGFMVIDDEYIQPPYSQGLPSVKMYLMATAPASAVKITQVLYSEVYNVGA